MRGRGIMRNKTAIIIGAGVAGMAAGCYLQMNGYKTKIYEMGLLPGGLCTGWSRKGYYFDGCISWLVGSGPNNTFHKFWKELNVIQNMEFINDEEFAVVNFKDGSTFTLYSDVDKLEQEFLRVAPEDEETIKVLTDAIRVISSVDLDLDKAPELFDLSDFERFKAKAGPYMKVMKEWGKVTIEEFSKRFKSPLVRENFSRIFWFNIDTSISYFIATMGWVNSKSAGHPVEGSLQFAKIIEKRYVDLGGEIHYKSKVANILVEDNKAIGIKLKNGQTYKGDFVISAADGYNTIYEMLEGKYVNEDLKYCYDNFKTSAPQIYVGLGVSKAFENVPHYMCLELERPLNDHGCKDVNNIFVKIYNKNPSFAPKGKTSIVVYAKTSSEYWEALQKNNRVKYEKEKKAIANEIIDLLDKRFGDIKSNIDVVDVSTPYTIRRYTNNRNGSWQGWEKQMAAIIHEKKLKRTLHGLEDFYMVGHWSQVGGGLPSVVLQARNLVQVLCKEDEKIFNTKIDEPHYANLL
ncbi:FAD dependent oxidoreductase [Bacillus thuringiensis serovar huazhongensis BGSC 4BD1]|nr:FAD dependent oxidoreductase [Bacillus thuringiensis serovar huazhongensis BGSC 4BD1]